MYEPAGMQGGREAVKQAVRQSDRQTDRNKYNPVGGSKNVGPVMAERRNRTRE